MKKLLLRAVAVIVIVWLGACGAIYAVMRRPPETFARVMARIPGPVAFLALPFETLWMRARAGDLHNGDLAPNFSLNKLDKTGRVDLAALKAKGQPVALIFGSYT